LFNKGFKYIETKLYTYGEKNLIVESKHKTITISFNIFTNERIVINIRNKKTNQNKSCYFINLEDNNLPKKYKDIIMQYILIQKLSEGNND
jgi:hypothetical protein